MKPRNPPFDQVIQIITDNSNLSIVLANAGNIISAKQKLKIANDLAIELFKFCVDDFLLPSTAQQALTLNLSANAIITQYLMDESEKPTNQILDD